jgi:drug/metabolite transporter (DMT)-like permease
MTIRSSVTAFWLLVLVNLIWGVGFVVVDDAINVMSVNLFNAFRFGVAAIALLPLWLLSRHKQKARSTKAQANISPSTASFIFTGFGLGLLLFLGFMLQTKGLLYTSVSNTGFITGLCVPFVPLIGYILYRTKVSSTVWLSVLLAVVGLYFLTIGDKLEFNSGDILVAFGALCYAAHITVMARVGAKYEVLALSLIQLVAVTLYSAAAAMVDYFYTQQVSTFSLVEQLTNINVLAAIAYSGILSSAFAFWAQTSSQRLIAPHKIALIFALEPIFAHIAAAYILDESMGIKGWIGASLILAGMLFSEIGSIKLGKLALRRKKVAIQVLDQTATRVDE